MRYAFDTPVHPFQPGDTVYTWTWKDEPLKERWTGPYTVLLKTYTGVKVNRIHSWIHYTRVKVVLEPDQGKWTSTLTGELKLQITKDCLWTVPGRQDLPKWQFRNTYFITCYIVILIFLESVVGLTLLKWKLYVWHWLVQHLLFVKEI